MYTLVLENVIKMLLPSAIMEYDIIVMRALFSTMGSTNISKQKPRLVSVPINNE